MPYVLLVESHDTGPKAGWRRRVKTTAVPPIVRGAASVLVVGSRARDSVVALGADPARVRVFANTIDVDGYAALVDGLLARRLELRAALGLRADEVAVVSVARLVPDKGLDTLLRASESAGVRAVVVGSGPERSRLEGLGTHAIFTGELPHDRVAEAYAAADVFALLSLHEPWGVAVNEAAAAGLPLVLSDRVGAAGDLLVGRRERDASCRPATSPPPPRRCAGSSIRICAARYGARSRELVAAWGYEPSVDALVEACREAIASR